MQPQNLTLSRQLLDSFHPSSCCTVVICIAESVKALNCTQAMSSSYWHGFLGFVF